MRSFVPVVQCEICTPGMVIAPVSLLDRTPEPSDEDSRNGVAGNLCRCAGYIKISKRWSVMQCGIRTPGMVIAAISLLERIPEPTGDCRCTGYIKIFEALIEACRLTRGAA